MITRRRAFRTVLLLVIVVLAGNLVRSRLKRAVITRPAPVHTTTSISADRALESFALSPDGETLAYVAESVDGRRHLFLRALSTGADRVVADTAGARDPFYSPDGKA